MTESSSQHPGKPEVIENRLYINGEFVPSQSGAQFDLYNPATEAHSASVYEAGPEDVDLAVAAAKAAFPAWSELGALQRAHYLEKWADNMEKCMPEMYYLDAICMGKPVNHDFFGSLVPIITRTFAAKALDITGDSSLNTPDFMNITLRQPYGVCGAIIPWNGPVPTMIMKVGAALITGNTIVVKTSEKAPLSCLVAARCAHEAGIPPGVLNILSGHGQPCGEAIARHMDIRKISFTGSTATGRAIQRMAAESNLKSVTLELGGKSPLVIWDDADLSKAVPAAARSILANTGQVCIASSRIYVHSSIASQFLSLLTATMTSLGASGDPLDPTTTRGPQADAAQFARVQSYLQLARDENIPIHLGGNPEPKPGFFIQPTILTDVPESSKLLKEEIFGPVVIVNTFTDEDDVMARANDTEYGLYASVYTRDLSRAMRAAKRFEAGSVCINCTGPTMALDMPFGGWKASGQGRELSRYATDYWTELKSVFIAL
ncbi:aldehyde dehydrogenase [Aspergillus sclerotioniger CBS 115572]|uniref:aldehyde dehydrogenase (NAD(+)) n=1 Tax=Aspergillus sclerotioniger CBS 115572 TaxID=1450535 RepID=A0A317VMS0_9EURO|nr:aldehyde dehydrogenase [Aspergillus sclerotioniger CBS 115572]PWY75215.1 aldehyde dehydrogenase [Aspergillus sclerotioniger CBS 115572]